MFAYDTNIFFKDTNIESLETTVCRELALYFDWFASNKLSLNVSKTNYMVFNMPHTHNHNFNITINNIPLQAAASVKFLGVYIDSKLNWHEHISHLCSQVAKGVGIIGRLKMILPQDVLLIALLGQALYLFKKVICSSKTCYQTYYKFCSTWTHQCIV